MTKLGLLVDEQRQDLEDALVELVLRIPQSEGLRVLLERAISANQDIEALARPHG
jgi:hypothetical protein